MVAWRFGPCFTTDLCCKCHSSVVTSSATGSRNSWDGLQSSGTVENQGWEDLSKCRVKRRQTRSSGYPQIRRKTRSFILSSEDKAMCITTADVPNHSAREGQRFWSANPSRPVDQLRKLCEQGQVERGLDVLDRMEQEGSVPTVEMYRSLLKACTRKKALAEAKRVHAHLSRHRLESSGFLGESVVNTLVKCGSLKDALQVFRRLGQRSVVAWTALISGHIDTGQDREALRMYPFMLEEGVQPDSYTFISLLKACSNTSDLEAGKRIHAEAFKFGYVSNLFVGTSLVDMYAKCGSIKDAQRVFDGLLQRDAVSWNAMLSGYLQQDLPDSTLQLYVEMGEEGVEPTARTFLSAVQACSDLAEAAEAQGQALEVPLQKGKFIHAEVHRWRYQSDVFVGNALVTMYAKCGSVVDAQNVFSSLLQRDVVSWNAMLAGYAEQGQEATCLELYSQMSLEDVSPDARTIVAGLQACGSLAQKEESVAVDGQLVRTQSLQKGKALHSEACTRGYESDIFVGCTLISTYGKCGSIVDAEIVFDELSRHDDVVPWNAMLAAYAEQSQAEKALQLYRRIEGQGMRPDEATFLCLLQACSNAGARDICVQVHLDLASTRHKSSVLVANTLIHAYGNCASMVDAQDVFDALPQPSVASWNTLIAGYARQGNSQRSMQCFEEMCSAGTVPNEVTFLSLLSACSHAGLVDKGVKYFESMSRDYGIVPDTEHYVTIVDLLGRAGHFELVEALLSEMPMDPNLSMSMSLLGACQKHGNVALGRRAFDWAVSLQPDLASTYVLMWNIYSHAGMWESAKEINDLKQKASAWKTPGQSWIEHDKEVHTFGVRDSVHQQLEHELVVRLSSNLRVGAGDTATDARGNPIGGSPTLSLEDAQVC